MMVSGSMFDKFDRIYWLKIMSNSTRSVVKSMRVAFFMSVCSIACSIGGYVRADESGYSTLVNLNLYAAIQSQDIDLPEDFIARLEDGKLKVVLESLGANGQRKSQSNLLIALLDENGNKSVAKTNSSGVAEFTNVKANALHALLVNDEEFHAAIPVMPITAEKAREKNIVASDIRMAAMPTDKEAILASVASNVVPSSEVGELYGVDDYKSSSLNLYRVRLSNDGTLDGRVVVADRDLAPSLRYANITIYRDRQPIAKTTANPEDGSFGLPNLTAGTYGVIAAGPAGYSAFAFEVLPVTGDSLVPRDPENLPVSFNEPAAASKLYVFLIPPKIMVKVREEITNAYRTGAAPGGMASGAGGFPGGGGFGGGGGNIGGGGGGDFGGGGGGGALAAAALVAALATSNGNSQPINNTPPPKAVSPIK